MQDANECIWKGNFMFVGLEIEHSVFLKELLGKRLKSKYDCSAEKLENIIIK